MKQARKFRCIVEFTLPDDVDAQAAEIYVWDAIACWKGGYHEGDPLFFLDGDTVRVQATRRRFRQTRRG